MEGEPKSPVWLTSALTESEVPHALTLRNSLKRVLTCQKIGVVVSKKLSIELINYLNQHFDYLYFLEDEHNMAGLKEQDFLKLFPLTLKAFEMCVFMSPTIMALKNYDQIFDGCRNLRFSGYLLTEKTGMDVFVVQPSRKVFETLMKGLAETSEADVENYIRRWTEMNSCMPNSDTSNLPAQGFLQIGGEDNVLLINSRDFRLDMNSNAPGISTESIIQQWKGLYTESVQPLLHLMQNCVVTPSDNPKFPTGATEIRKPTLDEVNQLMREDCQLPENIRAQTNQGIGSVKEVKRVLLTGCTGSLGRYVLKELTNLPQITQVICLMRPSTGEPAEERLNKVLSKLGLLPQVDMGKVLCVSGNVAEPHLGMKETEWEDFSQNVDAVFHCAALVKHVGYYRKTDSNTDMRAVNIGGTKNVLEFACKNKLKHVYNASTILAVALIDDNGRISESWPEVGDFDGGSKLGYLVTKFVGDVLMKQAVERGIPCKVFRLPFLSGESETGRSSIERNHVMLRYLFMMKKGIMPSEPFYVPALPIDICVGASLQIFFNENAGSDLYNISNGYPDEDQKFVEVAKEFGCHVDEVEFSEFVRQILECGGEESSALVAFKKYYKDEEEVLKVTSKSPILGGGNEESEKELRNKWWSDKVAKLVPNFFDNQKPSMDYIRQDLLFCKRQGWLKKFGL